MSPIDRCVGIVGFGSQGVAWAANLADSGVDVRVVLRQGSASAAAARAAGLTVVDPITARDQCRIFAILGPDAAHASIVNEQLAPLHPGDALVFAHGYSVHYGLVSAPPSIDVILVAPKGIGPAVRSAYQAGHGVPALIGVAQDPSGHAWDLAQSIAEALGCARAGIFRSSFREETEADLFSEQALLIGGVPALLRAVFDLLVERGTSPQVAYFECLEELKLIVDMMVELGPRGMLGKVSDTAKLGGALAGQAIVDDSVRATLERLYTTIVSGAFHRRAQEEARQGDPAIRAMLADWDACALEAISRGVRVRVPVGGSPNAQGPAGGLARPRPARAGGRRPETAP